jgi:hypothetical protein
MLKILISILCDNFLTVQNKRKLPRVISFLVLKGLKILSVIVKFGLFKPIFRHLDPDPDSEYESGSRIQAQIECVSYRIRIRNTVGKGSLVRKLDIQVATNTSSFCPRTTTERLCHLWDPSRTCWLALQH